MTVFPALRTGAVIQYPAERSTAYSTSVSRFVDGTEQRSPDHPTAVRKWTVRLNQLDEGELAALDAFFTLVHGSADAFSFTDPWDGTVYHNCTLQQDDIQQIWNAPGDARTQLVILENRT